MTETKKTYKFLRLVIVIIDNYPEGRYRSFSIRFHPYSALEDSATTYPLVCTRIFLMGQVVTNSYFLSTKSY